ncbi:bifunctional riboflavin kinase/FAD synthetase [bacterium]|nr:bifunctional riboflavin kinase/FAD synthetase [bacterium]
MVDFRLGGPIKNNTVVTIGSFDGVHLGHQSILNVMQAEAQAWGLETLVASFDPHPREVLTSECKLLLSPVEERSKLLAEQRIHHHALIPFSVELSQTEPEDFVKSILVDLFRVKRLIVGYDHRFGRNRRGDVSLLQSMGQELDFKVIECDEVVIDSETISSSGIRTLLSVGSVSSASAQLGRRYSVTGTVVRGAGRGKGIGIPTANIEVHPSNKLIPKNGVYAVRAEIDSNGEMLGGMMNIGSRPTFERSGPVRLEVNLFDFGGDLYDREVRVEFVERVRDERKFGSASDLIEQLNADRVRCNGLLSAIS